MSATLTAKGLSAAHGDRTLFAGLDLVLAPGDALGVVGPNGAGKSTLFKLLAGLAPPGSGRVSLSPPGAIVGYLPQESDPVAGETVLGLVARRTGVAPAQAALDARRRRARHRPPDRRPECGGRLQPRAGALAGPGSG